MTQPTANVLSLNDIWRSQNTSSKSKSHVESLPTSYRGEGILLSIEAKHYYREFAKWRERFLLALEGVLFSIVLAAYSPYWIIIFILFAAPALRYGAHVSSLYLAIKTEGFSRDTARD